MLYHLAQVCQHHESRSGSHQSPGFAYLPVCRMITSRVGPCAPCTRIFSISAVRLEPLMTHANELWASLPCLNALRSAVCRSVTSRATVVKTMRQEANA